MSDSEDTGLWRRLLFGLEVLQVPQLDRQWVDDQFSTNFCEHPLPPFEDFDSKGEGVIKALDGLRRTFNSFLTDDTGAKALWARLGKKNISCRSVTALLYYFIETGNPGVQRVRQDEDEEEENEPPRGSPRAALLAAVVYLLLVRMPGSGAYNIYHSIMLRKALDLLEACVLLQTGGQQQAAKATKGRGRKGGRRARADSNESMDLDADEEEDGAGGSTGKQDMGHDIVELLDNFLAVAKSVSLGEGGVSHLVDVMVTVVKQTVEANTRFESQMQSLALDVLSTVVSDKHVVMEHGCMMVLEALQPALQLTAFQTQPSPVSRPQYTLAKIVLDAVRKIIMEKACQAVHSALLQVIKQMCLGVAERAEYRAHTCEVVARLIDLLPEETVADLLSDWLLKYGRNAKVGYRLTAIGVISCILTNHFAEGAEGSLDPEHAVRLIQAIVARASDKIPTVRAKALGCMADIMELPGLRREVKSEILGVSGENGDAVLQMVRHRVLDEKTHVRKAALQVLEEASHYAEYGLHEEDALCMHERCMDPIGMVRKQALSSLNSLATLYPANEPLQGLWLDAVLPLAMDPDVGIQDKVADMMDEAVLAPLQSGNADESVWLILSRLPNNGGNDLTAYFTKCCKKWATTKKLTRELVDTLLARIVADTLDLAPWVLLAELATIEPSLVPYDQILAAWDRCLDVAEGTPRATVYVVRVLASIADGRASNNRSLISKATASSLAERLQCEVSKFHSLPALMAQMITTITQLVTHHDLARHGGFDKWDQRLMGQCEAYLADVIFTNPTALATDTEKVAIYLFTLGELAQNCPGGITERVTVIVQSLISAIISAEAGGQHISVPPTIRAHAFIALGKVCLQREDLSKKIIPALVKELETGTDPVIRNNIMVVMCDLCVRYSTLIDSYIPNIASCLRDESPVVRQQTLALLTPLLQEDYVKWKGSLFFRFVSTLVDNEPDIRRFAEFCLVNMLSVKHPNIFFSNFVEAVFHFNGYTQHKAYNRFHQSPRELRLFSLQGPANANKRMAIYESLLDYMTDHQRFQLTAKLVQDILGAVAEKEMPLDKQSEPLLADTLRILASKHIKLSSLRNKKSGEEGEDEPVAESAPQAQAKAKAKKVEGAIVKMIVVERIVPTVISLKRLFEEMHSPLLGLLMEYLRETMEDYKEEVNDVLSADKQLAEELQYDLRRYEEEKAKQAGRAADANNTSFAAQQQQQSPRLQNSAQRPSGSSVAHTPLKDLTAPRVRTTPSASAAGSTGAKSAANPSSAQRGSTTDTPVRRGGESAKQTPSSTAPSPMPSSLPIRVYAEEDQENAAPTSTPAPRRIREVRDTEDNSNVLVLQPPNEPLPKPRQWNISSPVVKGGKTKPQKRDLPETPTKDPLPAPKAARATRSRGTIPQPRI